MLKPVIHVVETKRKAVAFTFDDGPNPLYTPQVLDIFRQAGPKAKATFMLIGTQLEQSPETARQIHEEGHEIANHTYTHPHLTELSEEECREELLRNEELILKTIGVKPKVMRPPYFSYNDEVARIVGELGYLAVAGAVNGEATDWEMPGVQHIVDKTREKVQPGSVLLFHDGYDDRSQTIEAVRILVPELIAEGYELVTVSELLGLHS